MDCRTNNPANFWKGWYSHKFKHAGVRYEVGICIQTGWIVWVNGPFPAGDWPDLNIFRAGLKNLLDRGELVEADNVYRGDAKVRTNEDCVNLFQYEMKFNVRARHETANSRIKCFKVLSDQFRHQLHLHGYCFNACAIIVQLNISTLEPLYAVEYRLHYDA